jgi:hypothetical protein
MGIRSDCVVGRKFQSVITQELTVGDIGISIHTLLRTLKVLVEEV